MADKPNTPTKDVSQILRFLTNTFNTVTSSLPRASNTNGRMNVAYRLQTEFAYLLNEIVMGPPCMFQRNIGICNEYTDYIMSNLESLKDL